MQLIDEDGNLFGVVNVIDALAVMLLLAVVVAGVAAVGMLGGDAGEPGTRYATIDLGEQPDYVVQEIDEGDTLSPENVDQNATVTDIYATTGPENGSVTQVVVRAELEGTEVDDGDSSAFEFAGDRLRSGDEVTLVTTEYGVSGQVRRLDEDGESLPVETEPVLLEATMSPTAAAEIEAGDTFEVGPYTIASVTSVQSYPSGENQQRVRLGVELEGLRQGGSLTFAGSSLTVGSQLSLATDTYTFSGEVIRRGATELDSEPGTRYATIDLGEQPGYLVDQVEAGDTMAVGDEELTVTDVHASPSGGGDGHLVVRAELDGQLVERPARDDPVYRFAGDRLRVGDGLEIDVDEYVVAGQVTSLEREGEALPSTQTPVLLETTVADRTAAEIDAGDTFELGPHTVATVETVRTYPVGDEQRRVHLGVELVTLERGTTPLFAGEAVTVGSQLSLSTDAYDVDGEVIRRNATEPAGDETTTTVEVKLENVDPDLADGLEAGMVETQRGETLATIADVDVQAAEVVLESEDGDIHLREHPINKDVRLTVDLRTLATDAGLEFHGETLRENETVVLDFGDKLVRPTVTDVDPDE